MGEPVVAVVTADDAEIRAGDIFEFLSSVQGQPIEAVVVQRGDDLGLRQRLLSHESVLCVLKAEPCGVSRARNVALTWLADNLTTDRIVSFPDDDCRYPSGLGQTVLSLLHDPTIRLLVGAYGPDRESVDRARFPDAPADLGSLPLARTIASVGVFAHLNDVLRVGGFNEELGVGALWDSGEEYDLVVRLVASGVRGRYDPNVIVQHPYHQHGPKERHLGWIGLNTAYAFCDLSFLPVAARAWAGLIKRVLLREIPAGQAWQTHRIVNRSPVRRHVTRSLCEVRQLQS